MRTKLKILYVLLICMSISTIARNLDTAKGNSAFVVSSALSPEPPTPPADTVKVKRTDYPHGEHADEYGMDLSDPENLKHDEGEYVENTVQEEEKSVLLLIWGIICAQQRKMLEE